MATFEGGVWTLDKKGKLIFSVGNVAVVTIAGLANLTTGDDGVLVNGEALNDDDVKFEYEEVKDGENNVTSYKGTVTLGASVLAMTPKAAVSLTNGKIEGKNFAGQLVIGPNQKVAIAADTTDSSKSSEQLVYTAKNGTAAIVANLTAGYNLAANGLSASYSAAGEVTLATISGLQKGLAEGSTVLDTMTISDTAKDNGTGIVTLTKAQDGNDMFTNSNITIAKNTKNAFANTLSYSLALGENGTANYAQQAQPSYWEIAKAGTATYKFETPEGYVYNTTTAGTTSDTQINYQKAFTTVIATVTGLNADAEVGTETKTVSGEEVTSSVVGTSAYNETTKKYEFTTGLTITNVGDPSNLNAKGVATNKGDFTVTVKDNVLPNTKGTLKVTPGTNYQVKADGGFVTDTETNDAVKISGTADHTAFEANGLYKNIWVINGNTAVYKKVRLGYYNTSVANQMTYVPQADAVTFLTITGLSSEALATNAKYENVKGSNVITSIDGLTWESESAPDATGEVNAKGAVVWTKTAGTLTIADPTSPKAEYFLFDKRNITIGKSDNVKLVIDAGLAPKFSEQKWNLSGTSATLKGTIKGGYTSSDDGKTIIYTADTKNATLATISGLKKGTVLTSGKSDSRTIGFGSGDSFKQGIEDERVDETDPTSTTGKLSYDDDGKLEKLDIEISANVLDTSKVALKSTFYKLKLDDGTDKGGAVVIKGDKEGSTNKYFTVSGTTATYKQAASRPFYTIDSAGTSITYTKEASPVTLATIKGISANTNINIYDTEGDGSATVASAQNTDNDIYIDNITGVITIKKGALNGTAITVTKATKGIPDAEKDKTYTFALDSNVATSKLKWTQTGNTVYLKADSGYAVSANGQTINYTKKGGQQTIIAQITGLQAGLFDSETGTDAFTTDDSGDVSVNSEVTAKGITLDNNAGAGSITLSLKALNNANVALTGAGGYKLAVKTTGSDTEKVPTEAKSGQETWVVNGTTAIFKAVNTSYYAYDENKNTLTYKKAADIKGAKVYATITGIKDGLLVNPEDGKSNELGYYDNGSFKTVAKIDITDAAKPVVTIVDSYALDDKDIVLNAKGSLAGATIKVEVPQDDDEFEALMTPGLVNGATASWTVNNKGVATYTGSVKAYYSNEDGKIAYHPANTSATIATITGLKTGLTDDDLTSLNPSTVPGKENEITLKGSLLAGKDVALTTNIQLVTGKDYKFVASANEAEQFTTYDKVAKHKGWSIVDNKKTGSTATYGEYTDGEYYELNTDGNELTYNAAGFNKEFAKLSGAGLKSGLVTIQNDALSEIKVAEDTSNSNTYIFTLTGDAINVGGDVTLEEGTDADTETYKLAIGDGISEPADDYTCVLNSTSVDIFKTTTDGYTLENSEATLKYTAEVKKTTGEGITNYGQVSGLNGFVIGSDGKIEGLDVNATEGKITVAKTLLPTSTTAQNVVTLTKAGNFTLALGEGISASTNDGNGYILKETGELEVYTGCTVGGYELAEDNKAIKYTPGAPPSGSTPTVKIKGLNISTLENGKFVNEIDGITIANNVITLSEAVLGTGTVTFDENTKSYSFALDDEVPKTDQSATWAFDKNKGTATYTEKVEAGYALDEANNTITYTPTKTVTSTLTNLNKNEGKIEVSEDGDKLVNSKTGGEGNTTITDVITFDKTTGVFKLAEDALANKTVILTTKSSVKGDDPGYKLDFATENIAAAKLDYVLTKNSGDTKATLTQTTESGYSLSADGKQIVYSSDPTTVTLATISGLNKDAVSETQTSTGDGTGYSTKIDGIEITEPKGDNPGTIKISSPDVLTTGNVTLGKGDNYKLEISGNEIKKEKGDAAPTFVADKKGVHYKNVVPAYYETTTDATGKTITYHGPGDGDTLFFTITGLNANAVPDATGAINGIEVNGTTVTLKASVLGTNAKTPIKITGDGYTLALDSDVIEDTESSQWKEQTEWVAEGSNYIYRTYDKGYYTKADDSKSITYTAPFINKNNNFVTISGLAADQVDTLNALTGITETSGTITLDNTMLDDKNVTLTTKGSHKLELDTETADKAVTESMITYEGTGEGWTTNNTTATLKGTISAGYLLNEAGTGVTYYNAAKSGQTIATISNLASGAKIDATADVTITNDDGTTATVKAVAKDDNTGYTTITLNKSQLGTKNVTIKGDFFKLNAATDSKSLTDDAKWVKAANKTVATYTQTTYKGFSPSADGKTLTYLAKTTDVNLATVNGVSKTLTTDDMGAGTDNSDNKAIFLNTFDNTITINKKTALNPGNVTLGKNDAYTLKAGADLASDTVDDHLTFNKGTANIMNGTSASWTETNDKLLTYTKPVETTVSTINGLPKNLVYDPTTSSIQGIGLDTTSNEITLGKTAVAGATTKNSIVLTNNDDNKKYKFKFNSTDATESLEAYKGTTDDERWDLSGTTLTITGVKSEGYSLDEEKTKVTYTAASDDADQVTKITGLPNKLLKKSADGSIVLSSNNELALNLSTGKTIGITGYFKAAVTNTDLTLKLESNNGYSFNNTGLTGDAQDTGKQLLTENVSLNGSATIYETTNEKWNLTDANKTLTHTAKKDTTYVTINGLNKSGKNGIEYTNGTTNVTLNSSALTTNNVTMARGKNSGNDDFRLVLGSEVNSSANSSTESAWKNQTEWVTSGGTATYKLYDKANWYESDVNTKTNLNSIIYVAPTKGTQFAAISGMAKNATLDATAGVSGGTITLGENQLEGITKAVTLKVTKAKDVVANTKKGISEEDAKATNLLIGADNDTAATFKLALDETIKKNLLSKAENAVWDTNGAKAILTGTTTKGYKLSDDQKTITYQAADLKGQTIATVNGLKIGSEIAATDVGDTTVLNSGALSTTVSLTPDHLGTSSVVISGAGYKLALTDKVLTSANSVAGGENSWNDQTGWVANKGTFVYKTYDKAYWDLNEAETTAVYHAAVDEKEKTNPNTVHQTYVTIKGLKANITGDTTLIGGITDSMSGEGVKAGAQSIGSDLSDRVITLNDDVLNKTTVTLADSSGFGYALGLDEEVDKSTVDETAAAVSTAKGITTVTWTGTKGIGYHVTNDGQSIEYYSAPRAKQVIAQVTGFEATTTKEAIVADYDGTDNVVTLSGDSLTSAVGISGTAEFSFDAEFNEGTITGSKAADKVSVAGSGVTVNTGKGNDYVDLGTSGNTFFYANGDGNDVIANFTAGTDKIKITNVAQTVKKGTTSTLIAVEANGNDAVVKVNNVNAIRLNGLASSVDDLKDSIYDKDNKNLNGEALAATGNVLADDNFATTPQLSSIVKASASTYSTEDLVATDATSLTKQSSAIAYSGSSKK